MPLKEIENIKDQFIKHFSPKKYIYLVRMLTVLFQKTAILIFIL